MMRGQFSRNNFATNPFEVEARLGYLTEVAGRAERRAKGKQFPITRRRSNRRLPRIDGKFVIVRDERRESPPRAVCTYRSLRQAS